MSAKVHMRSTKELKLGTASIINQLSELKLVHHVINCVYNKICSSYGTVVTQTKSRRNK